MTAHTESQRQQIKAAVRARDGRCTECGMSNEEHVSLCGKQLHVHRVQPGSPYSLEGCVSLCKNCHARAPKRKPGENDTDSRGDMVRIPLTHYKKMQVLARRHDRRVSKEVKLALEDYMRKHGIEPPPKPPEDED
jgi:hypothetical protein